MIGKPEQSSAFWIGMLVPFAVIGTVLPLILLRAWALSWLWQWYIVPSLGAPPLRTVYAFGIALTVNAMLQPSTNDKRKGESKGVSIATAFFSPIVALLIGWIGTLFI